MLSITNLHAGYGKVEVLHARQAMAVGEYGHIVLAEQGRVHQLATVGLAMHQADVQQPMAYGGNLVLGLHVPHRYFHVRKGRFDHGQQDRQHVEQG